MHAIRTPCYFLLGLSVSGLERFHCIFPSLLLHLLRSDCMIPSVAFFIALSCPLTHFSQSLLSLPHLQYPLNYSLPPLSHHSLLKHSFTTYSLLPQSLRPPSLLHINTSHSFTLFFPSSDLNSIPQFSTPVPPFHPH